MFGYSPRQICNIMLYISKNLQSTVPTYNLWNKGILQYSSIWKLLLAIKKSITIPSGACIHDMSNFIESYSMML
jgi:hypothetical protein